ncbi:hypothetical protein HDU97_008661 [Phlyctochytrium planicorne]|nr:hypothetical protein HDU97_008661 [Phlyctochytrium planicorne]
MAAEEAERLQMDRQYAMEESERRKEAIDRAKRLQYNNQDSVRAFHSRVLLYQVLRERDLQLQIKQQRNRKEEASNTSEASETTTKFLSQIEDDAKLQLEQRKRQYILAQEQKRQIEEKAQRLRDEKSLDLREGKELELVDEQHKDSMRREAQVRRLNCLSLRDQLLHMKEELKKGKDEGKRLENEENKRIQAWIARKTKQSEMKKDVEKKWFNESIRLREQLGEVQAKLHTDADARIEEQMRIAIEKKNQQEKKEEMERKEKKRRQQQELRDYFHEYVRQSEIKIRVNKELEKQELEYYRQVRDDAIKEQKQKKAKALREGKELQEYHRSQMERIHALKKKEKEERLEIDNMSVVKISQEDRDLQSYIKSIAKEDWALEDHRLQKYIAQAPLQPKKPRPSAPHLNTHNRLGFTPSIPSEPIHFVRS